MVKKNFRIKLNNKFQIYTNISLKDESEMFVIYRFLTALRHSNAINEQLSIINKITPCKGYSKTADETYFYDVNTDKVEVRECKYNKTTSTFRKGKLIDTIKWVGGKIQTTKKF